MRSNRIKDVARVSFYHCICRCVGLQELLKEARIKNVLQEMLWRAADFSGVQVITYCIMDDHFHLLVRVPPKDAEITEEELLLRYKSLYLNCPSKLLDFTSMMKKRLIRRDLAIPPDSETEELIARLKNRMHDISEFMKTLKQRFTQWYNNQDERIGTLWTERFKSLIIEDNPHLLATIAAYIEMNPVRAGICEKPKDHRWCGIRDFLDRKGIYSAVQVAGDDVRSESCQCTQPFSDGNDQPTEDALRRERLFFGATFYKYAIIPLIEEAQAEFTLEKKEALEAARKALNTNRKEALEAMNLPMKTLLMGRLRHLAEGVAIGSILFLQVLASAANGPGLGGTPKGIPVCTGLQVDEELKLMCLRRIRGPKIE